jgi:hypothetical protein
VWHLLLPFGIRDEHGTLTLMTTDPTLQDRALAYHQALPQRIRSYLKQRGIPDLLIDLHLLGWNGQRITIPICNSDGELVFFKLAKDPADKGPSPKMLAPRGAHVELYGWEEVWRRPSSLVICEGEFDRLVLQAQGFPAVTSTGGAGSFREEWVAKLQHIPDLYICYDRDEAGRKGANKVGHLFPRAKLVVLPQEAGEGGDVTDFFVRLGRTREDFLALLKEAEPVPSPQEPVIQVDQSLRPAVGARLPGRIRRIERGLPIRDYCSLHHASRLRRSSERALSLSCRPHSLIRGLSGNPDILLLWLREARRCD